MAEQFKLKVPKEDIVKKESDALNKMAGAPPLQDILGRAGKARSTKDIMGLRSEAAEQELGAIESERQAATQKPIEEARAKGEYMQKEAQQYQGLYDTYQQKMQQTEIPQFKPTEDNLMTLSAMAGLISVVGNVVGKTGGMSGLSAINSMTAMMKGYQTGRKDLFEREKAQFDKDMQRLKAEQEKLMREFEMGYKKIPYNLAEAKADMELAIAKSGSQFLKATYDRQGATMVHQRINEAGKDVQHLEDMATKVGLAASKGAKDTGALPKDKDTNNQYLARKSVIKNIDDIDSLLKDPKYAKLIGPETKFTPDMINNLRANFPELSQKLARIQAIEFEIGGKNLTAKEQEVLAPIYGWKGLTAGALKERIKGVKEDFEDKNAILEKRYPGFVKIGEDIDEYYASRGVNPNQPMSLENEAKRLFGSYEPDKYDYGYENGRLYRDSK